MRTAAIAGLLAFSLAACKPKEVEAPKTIAEASPLREPRARSLPAAAPSREISRTTKSGRASFPYGLRLYQPSLPV